jgi:hypothetical protein
LKLQCCFEEGPQKGGKSVDGEYTFDTSIWEPGDVKNGKRIMGNVMWIRRKDGIAYRVGVGQIHLDAWRQSNPAGERILLG